MKVLLLITSETALKIWNWISWVKHVHISTCPKHIFLAVTVLLTEINCFFFPSSCSLLNIIYTKEFSQPKSMIQVGVIKQEKVLLLVLYNITHEKDTAPNSTDKIPWPVLISWEIFVSISLGVHKS